MSNIVRLADRPELASKRGLDLMIQDTARDLANARTLVEAVKVIATATLLQDMSRVLGASMQARNNASALHLEAEAKFGSISEALPKATAGRTSKVIVPSPGTIIVPKKQALADVGVSQQAAHEREKVAAIPEKKRVEYYERCQAEGVEVTRTGLLHAAFAPSGAEGYDGDEWYTPARVVEMARKVLGGIDLDPASNPFAQKTVRASRYFTKKDDALSKEWRGRVFCNPPYSMPLIGNFTAKLLEEFDAKRVQSAIYLVNNGTDTGWFHSLLERFPVCIIRGRLDFYNAHGHKQSARQGQAIFYLGGARGRFDSVFSDLGVVLSRM